MMSEVLAECLNGVLLTCVKPEKGHCIALTQAFRQLLLARSLGIIV